MRTKKFEEIVAEWKTMKRNYVKKSTFSVYVITIEKHLIPFFGQMTSINESDIEEFTLLKHKDGLCNKSIKDILVVLRMILKYANKRGYATNQAFEIAVPPQLKRNDIEVFTIEHQRRIMKHIRNNFTFRNLGIYLSLSVGVRIGEVCALQWKDLDVNLGIISITKTIERIYKTEGNRSKRTEVIIDLPKTKNSIRDIPMPNDVIKLVKLLKPIVNPEFYILTNEPYPIEPRTYRNYYSKFLSTLNVPRLKFHGLRHSFATRCVECNCDYKTVSVLLGHSNISTTLNLYVHPNTNQKKKCIDKMIKSLDK